MDQRRWIKPGLLVLAIAVAVAWLAPRLYVRNSNSHLTIDGRVTDDFRLYFGPSGRMILRIGAKQAQTSFIYLPHSDTYTIAEVRECSRGKILYPPFIALPMQAKPDCPVVNEQYLAVRQNNSLVFRTRDRHIYEVTWQAPRR
jgi:hypothetical protein